MLFQDERTSNQVRDYLELGSSKLLTRMYNKALGEKHGFLPDDEIKPREPKNKGIGKSSVKSAPPVNVQKEIKVGNDLMHRIFMIIQDIIIINIFIFIITFYFHIIINFIVFKRVNLTH